MLMDVRCFHQRTCTTSALHSGSDAARIEIFKRGRGAAGETDVTVLFKSTPGSRRWQHTVGCGCAEDCGYTVILGSNRNRCLKIERDGQTCAQACPLLVPAFASLYRAKARCTCL